MSSQLTPASSPAKLFVLVFVALATACGGAPGHYVYPSFASAMDLSPRPAEAPAIVRIEIINRCEDADRVTRLLADESRAEPLLGLRQDSDLFAADAWSGTGRFDVGVNESNALTTVVSLPYDSQSANLLLVAGRPRRVPTSRGAGTLFFGGHATLWPLDGSAGERRVEIICETVGAGCYCGAS